jgi:hypothetical protein
VSSVRSLRSGAVAALVALLGLVSAPVVAGATVVPPPVGSYAPAQQLDPPQYHDCGDTVYESAVAYYDEGLAWAFKVVGVDLRPWLGSGLGTMEGTMTTEFAGSKNWGPVTASPTSGARTDLLQISDPYDKGVRVHAWITNGAGHVACEKWIYFGPEPPR